MEPDYIDIDEAVFISDQVVIFSDLPAHVKDIIPVSFPHLRDRTSPEFNAIRKKVLNQGEFLQ